MADYRDRMPYTVRCHTYAELMIRSQQRHLIA
jgi:hypothetical protein